MAFGRLLNHLSVTIARLEEALVLGCARTFNPGAPQLAWNVLEQPIKPVKSDRTIQDIIGDGFLFAVPHHRRSIERRLKRKFGHPDYVFKLLQAKTTLRVCNTCGDNHEVGVLCPSCYKRVKAETKAMQDQIVENLKLDPIDKEVAVLYEGEQSQQSNEYWQGKRIIEMKKPRPNWFSKNLTQQTTQQPADTSDIKPNKLG